VIKKLISLSVNLDCQGSHPFEWTALMLCIDKRYTEAAMILIKAGANVHIRNLFGDTALMHAVEEDNLIVVEALLQQGARTDVRGKSTESPYYLSTIQQSTKKGTRYSAKMNHLLSSPRAEANNRKPSPYPLPDISMSISLRYEGNRRSSNTDIAHASNNRSGVNHPSKKAKKAKSTHKPMQGGPTSGHPVMVLSEADMITLATNAVIASDGSMVIPGEESSIS
jgi:ankyrin repeat protein